VQSLASSVVDDALLGTGELDNTTRELFADVFAKFQPTDQDTITMVCNSLGWRLDAKYPFCFSRLKNPNEDLRSLHLYLFYTLSRLLEFLGRRET
jgi:hypothetical protein